MSQIAKLACTLSALAVLASCAGPQSIATPPVLSSPPPTPTKLRVLYRVLNGGTDRMTSVDFVERTSYPFDGEMYYVADEPGSGRTALNRYVNAGVTDHADGIGPPDGYSLEETLGYPWTQASLPGLEVLSEGVNPSTGDYALVTPLENLPGYSVSAINVYGYPRLANNSEVLLSLSAGGVKVESNRAAGGVTWRWFWNGMQFENHFAYGSQIQAAFYFGTGPNLNPTEAGNGYYPAGLDAGRGSPTVRFENQGNTQITRAVPLNWDPAFFGGDLDHPVIWDSLILGKDLTLNFNNMGPVAKYTTHLTLPAAGRGTMSMPAGCLRGNFNRFWTYDAQAKRLIEVTDQVPNGCANGTLAFAFNTNNGGVIISDATANYAMGVYGVSTSGGGPVTGFGLVSYPCAAGDTSENAYNFNVWIVGREGILFPAGDSSYNTYIITESVQNVSALMDELYRAGVH